jgi:CRP-like cAMP-binding protein
MASTSSASAPHRVQKPLEDPLAYLPCSAIIEYRKGQKIYDHGEPAASIHLVIDGIVKVSRMADNGHPVIVDIYRTDEFFGEGAFLNLPHRTEQATALKSTKLMTWSTSEIEAIIMKHPRLAVALLPILVQRTTDYVRRIESFTVDNITCRLARALLYFSERMGTPQDDGSTRMAPFTHETLAQYVGTSREMITGSMIQLRRKGYLQYSRKRLILYHDALRDYVRRG